MKIEAKIDVTDDIIAKAISQHIIMNNDAIKRLKIQDRLLAFQQADLLDFEEHVAGLKVAYKYFTGEEHGD